MRRLAPGVLSATLLVVSLARLVSGDGVIIENEHKNKPADVSTGKFRIPNPFDLSVEGGQKSDEEFHYFKSTQSSFEPHQKPSKIQVEEYFSLASGLTYSLHKSLEHPEHEWAVLGDSARTRFYVVRNPHARQAHQLDCELDHAHTHRQVFPWQFMYELPAKQSESAGGGGGSQSQGNGEEEEAAAAADGKKRKKQRRKRKARGGKKAFVYGVGAIWLNAITLNARSDLVGDASAYPESNSWSIAGQNRLKLELLFEKIEAKQARKLAQDPVGYQELLDQTKLNTVRVDRSALVEKPLSGGGGGGGGTSAGESGAGSSELEFIIVQDYKHGLKAESEPELERFQVMLEQCRKQTKAHRLFPSLMRSLSTAPGQHYQLHYMAQRLPLYREAGAPAGKYDERKHRYTYPMEFVSEVFSLVHEAQTTIYSPLPFDSSQPGGGRTDVFIARFTGRANKQRSSRHSTAHFHLIEHENSPDDQPPECKPGEHEPLPAERLFKRALTFTKPLASETGAGGAAASAQYHAHLTGLGALLMNAADFHYKEFSLTSRQVRLATNPQDLSAFREAQVDEWRLLDEKLGWSVHFLVEKRDAKVEKLSQDLSERARGDLARLVRIDVRDARHVDMSIDVLDTSQPDQLEDDSNLLMQFTILKMEFDSSEEDVDFLLSPPEVCDSAASEQQQQQQQPSPPAPQADSDDDSDSDADSHFDDSELYNTERYYESFSSDEDSDEDSDDESARRQHDSGQQEGEQFEFQPGLMHEDLDLPSFFDFLNGGHAYEMLTKIELEQDQDDGDEDGNSRGNAKRDGGKKHIWLREQVDLQQEALALHLYHSEGARARDQPDESYHIFYEAELVFRVAAGRCKHTNDIDEAKWLRLLSTDFKYYTVPNIRGQKHEADLLKYRALVESSRISLFGMGALWRRASESPLVTFLGKKHDLVVIDSLKYNEFVWNYEEHEMNINFHFLQNLTMIELDRKADRKRAAHEYLTLHEIEFKNKFADDLHQVNTFGHIRARLEAAQAAGSVAVVSGASRQLARSPFEGQLKIPALCQDQYVEAQRMREQSYEQISAPSFFDVAAGRANSYQMRYMIKQSTGALDPSQFGNDKRGSTIVVETFDRQQNLGTMKIMSADSTVTLFIEARRKRIFAHMSSKQYGEKCSLVASIAPIFGNAIHLELDGNADFDAKKMYGLANLWIELAKLEGSLHIHYFENELGRKREAHTYKFHVEDSSPNHHEPQTVQMRFYKKRAALDVQNAEGKASKVVDGIRARADEELELGMISVQPALLGRRKSKANNKHKAEWYDSSIYVTEVAPNVKLDWQLPLACKSLVPDVPDDKEPVDSEPAEKKDHKEVEDGKGGKRPADEAHKFPDLRGLMDRMNLFHMKAEVSIQGPLEKVYLLEEWLHNNHLRVRSRGLGKSARHNFDFIIYEDTREQFDLSRPFSCARNSMPATPLDGDSATGSGASSSGESNLLQVWVDETTLIKKLAQTYYSPLTLWRMAQKSTATKKLVNQLEIAPLPNSGQRDDYAKLLEFELERESWLVSAPKDSLNKWSYRMDFVRKSRVLDDGDIDTWHILQSISLHDYQPESFTDEDIYNERARRDYNVFIEVANYKYDTKSDDVLDKFRLPEGWGCVRAPQFVAQLEAYDEFRLDEQDSWLVSYEASLELVYDLSEQDDELGTLQLDLDREMLPTVSGLFLRPGTKLLLEQPEMDISTHHSQVRFNDGHALARRVILDRAKSLEYEIDKSNGFCTIALVRQPGWQLVFPRSAVDSTKSIELNLLAGGNISLFRQLFLDTAGQLSSPPFSPLNKFTLAGHTFHSSYERELDSLKLSDELVGPARIVRKFAHSPFQGKSETVKRAGGEQRKIKWHDAITTRVFLLDHTKSKVRAIADFRLVRGPEPAVSLLLGSAQVRQCFNDGTPHWDEQVRSFTLDYAIQSVFMRYMLNFNQREVRDKFYVQLMQTTGLLPLQLDGQAQIGIVHQEDLLRVQFNVMDAPTSYVYFKESMHCTMEEELELKAESRIAASLLDCSHWCDQLACAAMSYCADHTCRVITARALFGKRVRSLSSNKSQLSQLLSQEQLQRLDSCKQDDSCSYYFQARAQPRPTLERLHSFLERAVNEERAPETLKRLTLGLGMSKVEPARFYEQANKFEWRREDLDEPIELDELVERLEGEKVVSWSQRKYAFGLLARDKKLDVGLLGASRSQTDDQKSAFISIVAHAGSIGECFDACERYNCLLLSHCKLASECLLAVASPAAGDKSQLADIRPLQSKLMDADGCSVHLRDRLSQFHKYEATRAPKEWSERADDVSPFVCAAMCHAAQGACLSFDFCTLRQAGGGGGGKAAVGGGPKRLAGDAHTSRTVCLLQKAHVSLDEFDRSVMLPEWESEPLDGAGGKELAAADCDHYSKNLLTDFKQLANRQLKQKSSGVVRGINEERCAAFCLQDERCRAFEFCRNERRHPAQACYLVRQEELNDALVEQLPSGQSPLPADSGQVVSSRLCSIYVARKYAQADRLEHTSTLVTSHLASLLKQAGASSWWSAHFLSVLVFLLAAISLGALVQLVHIRVTNRALVFDQHALL